MAFSPISGKTGAVKNGATSWAFSKWTYSMKTGTPKVTNFTGLGYRQLVSGITEGTISVEGPYDTGNMAFTSGLTYTLELDWTPAITLAGTAILASLEPSMEVEDAGRVKLTFEVNGAFVASIV